MPIVEVLSDAGVELEAELVLRGRVHRLVFAFRKFLHLL